MLNLVGNLREAPIRALWDRLQPIPGGKKVFSKILGRMAPYTGSIGASIEELRPGYARVTMRERHALRQHLGSVHAIALANLGEVTTGLALLYDFPADARCIVTTFKMDYKKKARGLLTAECSTEPVRVTEERAIDVVGEIVDEAGDVCAVATATWLVRPRSS